MDLIIASNNSGKVRELRQLLRPYGYNIFSLRDKSISIDIVEDGETFRENAYKKANVIFTMTGCASLADDSGLEVAALGGRPGIYSARYAGSGATDEENNAKLLAEMRRVSDRSARFVCHIVLLRPDKPPICCSGETAGLISETRRGTRGFGYDCLFYSCELGKTFAEVEDSEKNAVSHRSRAIKCLISILEREKQ